MTATRTVPLQIRCGDDYVHTVAFGENVSARTFTSQLRRRRSSPTPLATFTVDMTSAATGTVRFTLPDATTTLLEPGPAVWDIQMVTGTTTTTWLDGIAVIERDVTRG